MVLGEWSRELRRWLVLGGQRRQPSQAAGAGRGCGVGGLLLLGEAYRRWNPHLWCWKRGLGGGLRECGSGGCWQRSTGGLPPKQQALDVGAGWGAVGCWGRRSEGGNWWNPRL